MYRCAITAPCVTRTGTYGTGRAAYKGCIGLHLILYSINDTTMVSQISINQFYFASEGIETWTCVTKQKCKILHMLQYIQYSPIHNRKAYGHLDDRTIWMIICREIYPITKYLKMDSNNEYGLLLLI